MQQIPTAPESLINTLYLRLEEDRNLFERASRRELGIDPRPWGTRDEWTEIAFAFYKSEIKSQKQLVRALFRAGLVQEVLDQLEVGTLPPFAVQAAFNRA